MSDKDTKSDLASVDLPAIIREEEARHNHMKNFLDTVPLIRKQINNKEDPLWKKINNKPEEKDDTPTD